MINFSQPEWILVNKKIIEIFTALPPGGVAVLQILAHRCDLVADLKYETYLCVVALKVTDTKEGGEHFLRYVSRPSPYFKAPPDSRELFSKKLTAD